MDLEDVQTILTGNGDPEKGVVFRLVNQEQKMATMEALKVEARLIILLSVH